VPDESTSGFRYETRRCGFRDKAEGINCFYGLIVSCIVFMIVR
jgi:hypothetical protein